MDPDCGVLTQLTVLAGVWRPDSACIFSRIQLDLKGVCRKISDPHFDVLIQLTALLRLRLSDSIHCFVLRRIRVYLTKLVLT